jgi:hypothetical protein
MDTFGSGPYVSPLGEFARERFSRDGRRSDDLHGIRARFLLLEPAVQDATPVTHLNVVLNWFEEVRQKAGLGLVQGPR